MRPLGVSTAGGSSPAVEALLAGARRSGTGTTLRASELSEVASSLEGLPLALELAAAQLARLPAGAPVPAVDRREGGGVATAFAWSWNLLPPWEQAALAQASAFRTPFSLASAEEVIDLSPWPDAPPVADVLASLVGRALVREEPGERLSLPDAVAKLAAGRLAASGAAAEVEARHLRHVAALAAALGAGAARGRIEESAGLQAMLADLEVAFERARAGDDAARTVRLGLALESVLFLRGAQARGGAVLAETLAAAERGGVEPALVATIHLRRALAGIAHADAAGTIAAAEAAQRLGAAAEATGIVARALVAEGNARQILGEKAAARGCYERALSLAEEANDRLAAAHAELYLGALHHEGGRLEEARAMLEHAEGRYARLGLREKEANARTLLGAVLRELGRRAHALRTLESALALHRLVGNRRWEAGTAVNLGELLLDDGRDDEAAPHLGVAVAGSRELGDPRMEAYALHLLGVLLVGRGDADGAREAFGRGTALLGTGADPAVVEAARLHRAHLALLERGAAAVPDAAALVRGDARPPDERHDAIRLAEELLRRRIAAVRG